MTRRELGRTDRCLHHTKHPEDTKKETPGPDPHCKQPDNGKKARGDPDSRCLHGIESHRRNRNQRVQEKLVKQHSTPKILRVCFLSHSMASREHQEMLSARPDNFETPKTPFSESVAKQATASSLQKVLQKTLLRCRPGSEDESDVKYAKPSDVAQ